MCSERILSVAARRTCPAVFSEMGLPAAAPEDSPATHVASVRVSEPRQSVGRLGWGGSLMAHRGLLKSEKASHQSLLVDLRDADALLEFRVFQRVS